MTDNMRKDAVVRSWFEEEAPNHAPRRLLEGVRAEVAEIRQERSTIRFGGGRSPLFGWAAATVAILLLAGLVGGIVGFPRTTTEPGPTPSPAATPTPTATSEPKPTVAPTPRGTVLPSGTYRSVRFAPGVAVTVPTGWLLEDDSPAMLSLVRPGAGFVHQPDGANIFDAVRLYARPVAGQPDGTIDPMPGVGTSALALANWLAARPQLTATAVTRTTLAGRPAYTLDFTLSPSAGELCGVRCVNLLNGPGPDPSKVYQLGILGTWKDRAYLVSAPDGSTVVVTIEDTDGNGFADEVTAALPIVESLAFQR
ncbi:MAG TPA: hypothetical protein VL749_01720 [Patescibacteria group bacterium]|nr:hypothetical protein [Patescibacteria group bacterium]